MKKASDPVIETVQVVQSKVFTCAYVSGSSSTTTTTSTTTTSTTTTTTTTTTAAATTITTTTTDGFVTYITTSNFTLTSFNNSNLVILLYTNAFF